MVGKLFCQHEWQLRYHTVLTNEDPLDRLPSAPEAEFNSILRQGRPDCLDGTRSALLKSIDEWVESDDKSCVFWLTGWAGTGKSTIAQTVARRYLKKNQLGASFFFSRGGGDAGHAKKFFTSIARQLASAAILPEIQRHISVAAKKYNQIASQLFEDQWSRLILEPLSDVASCTIVIVVDALDECESDNDIKILLQLLAQAGSLQNARLRIFLTSRPDVPVQHAFNQALRSKHLQFILHHIESHIVDHDILLFLDDQFRQMAIDFSYDAGWPGNTVIRALLQQACGLFIWVATACRFIKLGGAPCGRERLEEILRPEENSSEPADRLDTIYKTVLENAVNQPQWRQRERENVVSGLREVLGTLVMLYSTVPFLSLQHFFQSSDQRKIESVLSLLGSILDVPADHARAIRLHHPSLRDFLLSKDRCEGSGFWVDEGEAHSSLAAACIRIMNKALRMDLCDQGSLGVLTQDIVYEDIQRCLSHELQYACLYWIRHLQGSRKQTFNGEAIHRFLREHVLHWMEAMSWMGKTSEAIEAMATLETLIEVSHRFRIIGVIMTILELVANNRPQNEQSQTVRVFVHDCRRFLMYARFGIEQAPLQTYVSAALFAPSTSVVRKLLEKTELLDCVKQSPRVPDYWSP